MAKRKSISKKTRFEVFKRDKFTCQYCGKSAPDIILQVDHIQPISKEGDNDISNYVTACAECNVGKGARELSDDSAVKKQKAQLDKLQERREQLAMMLEWQRGLVDLEQEQLDQSQAFLEELISPHTLNDTGLANLKKWIRQFGLAEILECTRISVSQYLKRDEDGDIVFETAAKVFQYIPKIAGNRKRLFDKPYLRDLYYIRGIVHNRMGYCNEWMALSLLEKAYKKGAEIDDLKTLALEAKNWTQWRDTMESWVNGEGDYAGN